jgi:Fur family ferric uptake transcriptional regulator/Fur family peroxide stress response transcriptional regulator
VLAALRAATNHPTAAEVYDLMRPEHPRLGRATVYRALAALAAAGLAVEVARDALGRHYDARTTPHDHAVCTICGALLDVDRPSRALPDDFLAAAIARGHEVQGFAVRYYGRCAACRATSTHPHANQ